MMSVSLLLVTHEFVKINQVLCSFIFTLTSRTHIFHAFGIHFSLNISLAVKTAFNESHYNVYKVKLRNRLPKL